MPDDALDLADKLWRGEVEVGSGPGAHHPFMHDGRLAVVADDVAFVPSFANVSAFSTEDGLVLVDTGSAFLAREVHGLVRGWSPGTRLHTAVYSHGHIDHVFGVPVFEEEASGRGWAPPRVVAHEALPARFDRYLLTHGYNEIVNQRQFQAPNLRWPTEYRYPDSVYADSLVLDVGGRRFELHHAKGETDDHTWTWVPDRRVLCCGDLFIWASPNAGNPQKVQRYPREWAAALREMATLGAEVLLPGHGFPVVGAARVHQALSDTAELLESLVEQTLAMMNAGARLDEIVHTVRAPAALLERPYLKPIYDEPEFVVRNIWRLYGGWYDGNPARLKPAPDAAVAREVAALAGGAEALALRGLALARGGGAGGGGGGGGGEAGGRAAGGAAGRAADGDVRLAAHLVEWAALADPESAVVQAARAEVYQRRAEAEASTMAKGVFGWAAAESQPRAAGSGEA